VKVIAFFCTKFSIIPCANLPSAHPIIYTFHTICKKRKYIILHSHHQGENTIPPTHFYFSLGKQKFLRGHAEKNSWADSKKQISYKTTFKQRQKKLSFKEKNYHHIAK